jgi:hypothetical protein
MSDHLDLTVPGFRRCVGLARQHGPGGGLGVDGVALAALAAELAVGPAHLDDAEALRFERPAEARAIRARALDAEGAPRADRTVTGWRSLRLL